MPSNTLGEFAQETARTVHEQGDRLIRVEERLEHMAQDRKRCNEAHAKSLEELGALARATADSLEAHIVEHKVSAATLDRASRNFIAIIAAVAGVLGATVPKLIDWLF